MSKYRPNHIVLTTINCPVLLMDYFENLKLYGHLDSSKIWIIGDKKTPPEVYKIAIQLTTQGLETIYVDITEQEKWGKQYPEFYKTIPYNNETRRNIGYLMALESGCERLISIDDDNYPTNYDFIGFHSIVGTGWNDYILHEENGFHNICEYLLFTPERIIFPRGYPFKLRGFVNNPDKIETTERKIVGVNAGLWLKEPDVDATTWLNGKITANAYKGSEHYVLHHDTWSPINTQNTSVIRELIPAFLCIPMGWEVPGGKIERYGDIWGGYFLEAILRDTPYYISFGQPLVEHRRNPHDYVDDLRYEFWGMILTDILIDSLKNTFKPKSQNISERVLELSEFLVKEFIRAIPSWASKEIISFVQSTSYSLAIWSKTCKKIGTF